MDQDNYVANYEEAVRRLKEWTGRLAGAVKDFPDRYDPEASPRRGSFGTEGDLRGITARIDDVLNSFDALQYAIGPADGGPARHELFLHNGKTLKELGIKHSTQQESSSPGSSA